MNKILAAILVVVFGVVGLAYAQSAKNVYETVEKVSLPQSKIGIKKL